MFCFNQNSCNVRYKSKPFWMSSQSWAPQFAQGGIFSNDPSESPFYNANLIYVKCAQLLLLDCNCSAL